MTNPPSHPVELTFPVDWYDGPLSGLCCYQGDVCWFDGNPSADEWKVYRLTQAERDIETANQQCFEELVGTHWSFEVPLEKRTKRDSASQAEYYRAQNKARDKERRKAYLNQARILATVDGFANHLTR